MMSSCRMYFEGVERARVDHLEEPRVRRRPHELQGEEVEPDEGRKQGVRDRRLGERRLVLVEDAEAPTRSTIDPIQPQRPMLGM